MANAFNDYMFFIQFGPAVIKSVAVMAIDINDPTMKIVYSSALLDLMFGYDAGELRGQSLDVLLRQEDVVPHHVHFANYQAQRHTRTMNSGTWVDAKRKDGSLFKVQVSLCVEPVGKMDCVIACIADVTAAFNHYHPDPIHH